jgi:hypothetical protein
MQIIDSSFVSVENREKEFCAAITSAVVTNPHFYD